MLETVEGTEEVNNLSVYSINDKNYFKLRAVAMLMDFNVFLNENERQIYLVATKPCEGEGSDHDILLKEVEYVTNINQVIVADNSNTLLSGYNIRGCHYFAIRDIAKIAQFECIGDMVNNTVILKKRSR